MKTDACQAMTTRSQKVQFKPKSTRTKVFSKSPISKKVVLANNLGFKNKKYNLRLNSGIIFVFKGTGLSCEELIIVADD